MALDVRKTSERSEVFCIAEKVNTGAMHKHNKKDMNLPVT